MEIQKMLNKVINIKQQFEEKTDKQGIQKYVVLNIQT